MSRCSKVLAAFIGEFGAGIPKSLSVLSLEKLTPVRL